MVTQTTAYTLRAGAPQPISECSLNAGQANLPIQRTLGFVLQTFKAERIITESCEDKSELLCSSDMIGLGGNFTSANYTAQRFVDATTAEQLFIATETRDRVIIEEDAVPGASLL